MLLQSTLGLMSTRRISAHLGTDMLPKAHSIVSRKCLRLLLGRHDRDGCALASRRNMNETQG